ncbi:HAD family hydrolase [Lactiplantibacillus daoliensis]|uniref:HAD family hydrolase n=1 Tax=Lactiplantibacillus daoliensis TaxID=2559916 RepID=A0ABW1UIN1_9LACO|nr:HAD family phosphatase [Lactiplantibacillus daoliensis]
MINTMIFDFNGTMFFDAVFQKASWGNFLAKKFNVKMTESEFQNHIAGRNNRYTFEYYSHRPITETELATMSEEKEQGYRALCLSQSADFHLVPGLPEFLDDCRAQGVKLNIATASERPNVEFFFKHLDLERWFTIDQVALNDSSLPGKPAPDIFLKAMANVGADQAESAIFEDSVSGIQAANRAQAGQVVLVTDPQENSVSLPVDLRVDQRINDYFRIGETLLGNQ